MCLVRSLQHWLGGTGPRLHVADFVPDTPPLRQWAATFPWAALVTAIEHRFATRFPTRSPRGRAPPPPPLPPPDPPVPPLFPTRPPRGRAPLPIRVWVALERLKHAWGAADEDIC